MTQKINAPLGSRKNRYAPRLAWLEKESLDMLETWFKEFPDSYVAISGGKDSTVCLDLARRVNPDVEVAFFDSGVEFPQTLTYIKRLQEAWGFTLHEFPAEPSALDVLEASGNWEHGVAPKESKGEDELHKACILRPLAKAQQALGRASIYGLRMYESKSREVMLKKTRGRVTNHDRKGNLRQTYLAPIWRWEYDEVHAYIGKRSIPLNPIYREMIRRGIPERRARVGMMIDGWALDQGRWGIASAIAPSEARRIEARLPLLAELR